ncbi:PAS domain S-box protein, partial [Nocardioides sp.]|uniref:PAS domain S-box protein n=1 Tax=Nocardioides sp. TaxID=35761 RepID=UPI002B26FE49
MCTADLADLDVDEILRAAAEVTGSDPLVEQPGPPGSPQALLLELIRASPGRTVAGDLEDWDPDRSGPFVATVAGEGARALIVGFVARDATRDWSPMIVPGLRALGAAYAVGIERHQLAEDLRSRDSLTQAVLEASLDSIITINSSGVVVEFNPAAEVMFGHSRSAAVGARMSDLIVPAGYRAQHNAGIEHYLKTGEGPALRQRVKLPPMRADGSIFPAEIAIVPVM